MKPYKILAFVDMEKGRDANILIPMAFFAETYLNAKVIFKNKYDAHALYRYKPDLVLLPNSIGSPFYFKISKYAHQNNIACFALVSEGNYWTNGIYDIFGFNKDRIFYHDYGCYWNERTLAYNRDKYPALANFFVKTGGVQFDRYKNYQFTSKQDYLKRHQLSQYKKVIGYAAWGFGKLFNKRTVRDNRFVRPNDPNRIEWMKQFMYQVEDTLKKLIEDNPDILFILKKHPNETLPSDTNPTINEIENLKSYPNVLHLVHEDVDTLLSVCDIWMGFDTTTVMEAWLMKDSPTFLLHTHHDFFRDDMNEGSLIIHSYEEIKKYIESFYAHKPIAAFEKIREKRKDIISSIIGFSDGLNHVRAGYYLQKTLENVSPGKTKKVRLNPLFLFRYLMIRTLLPFYKKKVFLKIPKLNKTVWIFDNWSMKTLHKNKKQHFLWLHEKHRSLNIPDLLKNPQAIQALLKKDYLH